MLSSAKVWIMGNNGKNYRECPVALELGAARRWSGLGQADTTYGNETA